MSVPVRDAATIILVDRSRDEPRLLMGRRHGALAFMPGLYVFPGGRVDPTDRSVRVAAPFAPHVERRLSARVARSFRGGAQSLGVAAVRELAEETGLLMGSPAASAHPARIDGLEGFAAAGLAPAIDGLSFVARAITPTGFVRRYDTRFFAADARRVAVRSRLGAGDDGELGDLRWVTIAEALGLDIATITRSVLGLLPARLEAGLEHDAPVPFFDGDDRAPADML